MTNSTYPVDSELTPVPPEHDAIGGYFGLELGAGASDWPWEQGLLFQSERAGFLALLEVIAPVAVWVPWYICNSMIEPLQQIGIPMRRYALNEDFRPPAYPELAAGECLLYVNYFGLCDHIEAELLSRYAPEQLILDHAQALYAKPGIALATLCSPRKFLGVPDGGGLWTTHSIPVPPEIDTASLARAQGLLQRTATNAEAGYAAYALAEQGLSWQRPKALSAFTRSLLASVDHDSVRAARRRNFEYVHSVLGSHNRLQVSVSAEQVPMSYPFWPKQPVPRAALHRARLYVPSYWPELLVDDCKAPTLERRWAAELLPLPIDQRYDIETLQRFLLRPLLQYLKTVR